jgi:HD-like signal output (HDOD) protein/ActR/RegA family two-component response regulator
MKSILFVGEDQQLWTDFRRHAASAKDEWAASFTPTAPEGLAQVEAIDFDVVVSDVQLPDRSGLDFLDEVLHLQPKALRIVLSDFADTQSTVRCIGRGHHHLSKPCDVTTLLNALNQEDSCQTWLPRPIVQKLISMMRRVPSPPTTYFQVVAEIQSPEASVERVGEIISQDPAIAAKVLQLANSAVFGLQLQVIEPAEAVAYIGLETTKSLVLLAHSFATFDQVRLAGFSVESLWAHSVQAGRFARQIAESVGASPEVRDQAFTAALLHDLGKLLFSANLPKEFGEALARSRSEPCPLHIAERRTLGACHAEVGACLLGIWGLPRPIVEAVALHHRPSDLFAQEFTPLTATHVANVLANESALEAAHAATRSQLDTVYLQELGFADQVEAWRQELVQ